MKHLLLPLLLVATLPAWAQHAGHATVTAPPTQSRADPDTPRPPEDTSGPMSMPVEDDMVFHQVLLDQLESTHSKQGSGIAWDVQGWIGRDDNRLWVKSEGARTGGHTEDGRLELLWSRPVAAFWDMQAGVRHDFGGGPSRNWLALGIAGIAPYWFDVEGAAYLGESGRVGLRLDTRYDVRLTQRTYLTPRLEANVYSRSDPQRGLGSGLSDASFGLRLRHEFSRQFAPYVGVVWNHRFGGTADQARASGTPVTERQWVAGVRAWF
jgi:copper resistance protein B